MLTKSWKNISVKIVRQSCYVGFMFNSKMILLFEENGYVPKNMNAFTKTFHLGDGFEIISYAVCYMPRKTDNVKIVDVNLDLRVLRSQTKMDSYLERNFKVPIASDSDYKYETITKTLGNIEKIAGVVKDALIADRLVKIYPDSKSKEISIECDDCPIDLFRFISLQECIIPDFSPKDNVSPKYSSVKINKFDINKVFAEHNCK